ncbi:MAG: presenilin family intramembrane aspartyl protease [archaeon]|nr:presenilin family intramembrane aspartyl protease [archaeon]
MKHSFKIVLIMLFMFLFTQLVGLAVVNQYSPEIKQITTDENVTINVTTHNLPYGTEPDKSIEQKDYFWVIITSLIVAVLLIFFLMKFKAELFLRLWFLFVITLALGITFNAFLKPLPYSSIIALAIALPLSLIKVFNRNTLVHNLTEVLIYPGIAAIFVPLLNIWSIVIIFIIISIYDVYAVWHSGFMQQMAKYQIKTLKVFSGFFIPYLGKKEKEMLEKAKNKKGKKIKIKVNVAILGGGDVVFPIMFAGVVLWAFGLWAALLISLGATTALALLFIFSQKGKFYPAMPFISAGCFTALALIYLIKYVIF